MAKKYIVTQEEFNEVKQDIDKVIAMSQELTAAMDDVAAAKEAATKAENNVAVAIEAANNANSAAAEATEAANKATEAAEEVIDKANAAMPKGGGDFVGKVTAFEIPGNQSSIRNMIFYDNAGVEITDNISVIKCYDK